MIRAKFAALLATAATAVFGLQSAPAHAAGPLLFAPWLLGHAIGALARAAVVPLTVGAAAASASYGAPGAGYPPQPSYGPGAYGAGSYAPPPAYYGPTYPPSAYYAPPATYYSPGPAYYSAPSYYRPAVGYGRPVTRWYGAPRSYYAAPRMRYSGVYGSQVRYRSAGLYRRR